MKITTWNVNGIRACHKNRFLHWFEREKAEVVCLQEIKANPSQLSEDLIHPMGYHSFWHPAEKAGYSGTAIYSKEEPTNVVYGIGVPEIDREGRFLRTDFKDVTVVSVYFPNSQRDHARLDYKLRFCDEILKYMNGLKAKGINAVLTGDFNIAHEEIDLRNPKSNKDNAGFLPEERAWMTKFLKAGYVDTFRKFEPGGGHYTWWSYRPGVREKNVGWRIDYHTVGEEFIDRVKNAEILSEVMGSDHCPIRLTLKK
jgi:exodeoxyribonuclease-3